MYYSHSYEKAREMRDSADELMLAQRVPAHPTNYAVWYEYVSGEHPDLRNELQAMLDEGRSFTDAVNRSLFDKHFGYEQERNEINKVGGRLEEEMADVAGSLSKAGTDSAKYCERITAIMKAAQDPSNPDALPDAIGQLVAETNEAVAKNRALEDRLEQSARDVAELRENLMSVRETASKDGLTGLLNRRSFDMALAQEIQRAASNNQPLSLIISDIDHFKRFNDTYGHQIGDEVIKLTSRVLTTEIGGSNKVARYGGEEFCVILPDLSVAEARDVAETVRGSLARRELINKKDDKSYGRITMSAGVSQFLPGESMSDFIERTDRALYQAKRDGRNRVSVATDASKAKKPAAAEPA